MQTLPATDKQRRIAKAIARAQVGSGIFFLGLAVYNFVSHGYNLRAVHTGITMIFGLLLPLIAVSRLVMIRKEEEKNNKEPV